MNTLWQDLSYGARMLLKKPGFTLIAVLTLALGIGANTAIFSVVNGVLLRPLAYHDPDRLVWVTQAERNQTTAISPPTYADYRNQRQSFESLAAMFAFNSAFNLTGEGEPERLQGRRVSASFFTALGVAPALGRAFLSEEDEPGRNRVVMLSHGLWQRRFGADRNIVGKALRLNGQNFTVVGVMPATFRWSADELWSPLALSPANFTPDNRGNEFLQSIARLKPQVALQQAQAELNGIAARIKQQDPERYPAGRGFVPQIKLLREQVVGDVSLMLLTLLSAAGFVLLIACANVANLLLARAARRQKEIAVRAALGASRFRLVRQMLTESFLLAALGGVGGLLLALWGIDLLITLNPANLPRLEEITVDARVTGFLLGALVLAMLLCGLVPALQASRTNLQEALKEGGRGVGSGRQRTRSLLVVAEVAMSLLLLVGAGLMIKSFLRLTQVNPGFEPDHLLTMQVALPASKYREPQQIRFFYQQALERIKALPGVSSAGAVSNLPLALALVGIYGVMSYTVAQRTREIGIRMALGAQTGAVLKLVIRQGMAPTLIGLGVGLIASFALTRLMKGLLFGVSATDPATFMAIVSLLTLVALLACCIPARRATKVDPLTALRYE